MYLYERCGDLVCELKPVPSSKENVYYYPFITKQGVPDCVIIIDAKALKTNNQYPMIFGIKKSYANIKGLYFEFDLTKKPLNMLYPARVSSKSQFDKVLGTAKKINKYGSFTPDLFAMMMKSREQGTVTKTQSSTTTKSISTISNPVTNTVKKG